MDIMIYYRAGTVWGIPRSMKERRWMKLTVNKKASPHDKWYAFVLIVIFFVMLVCNFLTKYLGDDFAYMFSFADRSRIEHLSQIIPSMAAHAKSMNGRLTAHALVQLSMMFPAWVFDVVNALMCVGLVWEIESLSRGQWKRDPLMAATVFCGIWVFLPSFGQVMLWQDGAINYLWSVCFAFPLLHLMTRACLYDTLPRTACGKLGVLALSYVAGSYLESTSLAVIACMILLLAVRRFYFKQPIPRLLIAALIIAMIGYVGIYLAPAQWQNKSSEWSLNVLIHNLVYAVNMYRQFGALAVVFAILMVICLTEKYDTTRILLAGILACGSLAANFIHIAASFYPERSAVAVAILLLAADAVLLRLVLANIRFRTLAVSLMVTMILIAIPEVFSGTEAVAISYMQVHLNEERILECREQGIMDIEIYDFYKSSKYDAACGIKYIDTENASSWPNDSMAKYYGVNSIIGK